LNESPEAAIWAFHDARDLRQAVLRAVNWGESGIPADWRDGLARRDLIENALTGLLKVLP